MSSNSTQVRKLAVVTGGAQRIGAVICATLHRSGYDLICTWRKSAEAAEALVASLRATRPDSAEAWRLDLGRLSDGEDLAAHIDARHGGLDLLVNNASGYFPTAIGDIKEEDWDELFASNAKGPLFLTQSLRGLLEARQGSVVNLLDANLDRAIAGHTVYMMAKSALQAMTRSLARELAPRIRVNAVAPGTILWSAHEHKDATHQRRELDRCFLGRVGTAEEVAEAVRWLAEQATHTTGDIIHIDGGQRLHK